jgi:peptidylprolyl isomerase
MKQPAKERGTKPLEWSVPLVAVIAITVCVFISGCTTTPGTQSQGAAPGDTVRVTYRMAFPGSEPFESNENKTPLEFILGSGVMIKGFDQAIVGMKPGETKTVLIPPELAYGQRDERLVGTINTSVLEKVLGELEKNGTFTQMEIPGIDGVLFQYTLPDSRVVYYRFTNITPETTTVDQNHPLAGRELEATITLLNVTKKP